MASATRRKPIAKLPPIKTLPSADVRFADVEGHPVQATRSDENGVVKINGLPDVPVGTRLLMTAFDGKQTESAVLTTIES